MLKQPYKIVDRDEERELFLRWKNHGDSAARNRLIYSCTGIVRLLAKKYSGGNNARFEELFQEGNVGILRAINKFDLAFENKFLTYASWWIKAHMQYYLRRTPLNEESLDEPLHFDPDATRKDLLTDPATGPEHLLGLENEEDLSQLRQAVDSLLSGQMLKVIKLRYYSGDELLSLEETGEYFPGRRTRRLSRERIRQIEKVAVEKLRNGLMTWEERTEFRRLGPKTIHSIPLLRNPSNNPETEENMGKIPHEVILRCLEKIGGKEEFFSSFEISKVVCEDDWGKAYSGIVTNVMVGQNMRRLVKLGKVEKCETGFPNKYRIKKSAGVPTPPAKALVFTPPTPPIKTALKLSRANEDLVFETAVAMLKLGGNAIDLAADMSDSLLELITALRKIPPRHRERALQVAKKMVL